MNDKQSKFTKSLHWTTIASEKLLLAIIGIATCIASAMYIFDMVISSRNYIARSFHVIYLCRNYWNGGSFL